MVDAPLSLDLVVIFLKFAPLIAVVASKCLRIGLFSHFSIFLFLFFCRKRDREKERRAVKELGQGRWGSDVRGRRLTNRSMN